MFKGFTDQARKAVSSAKEEAEHLNHEGVDTEHLLLALVRGRIGMAVAALERLELSHTKVRLEVMKFVQPGFGTVIARDESFTARLRKVFELAAEEAHRLGHPRIGTEHLLLGLLMEGEGVASEVLEKLHLTVDRLRREIQVLHLMYAQFVTDLARRDSLMKMAVEEYGLVINQVAETDEKYADSSTVEVGKIYQGKVKRIMTFGAFCEILPPGKEGLVHISELADHYVNKVEDVVKVGDEFPVKVIEIDEQGRINLSRKRAK